MVSVPVSNRRRIGTERLSPARFRYSEARNDVGEAVENLGVAARRAANDWDEIEATYDEADALRIDNEAAQYVRERMRTGENAYLTTKGFDAGNGREQAEKDLDQAAQNLISGARSQRAQNMAKRALDVRMGDARERMAIHANREMLAARNQQSESRIASATVDAVDGRGTDAFAVNLGLALNELQSFGQRQGWDADTLAAETAKLTSSIYAKTVLAIDAEDGEPTRALEFLEANKDQILPEQQAGLENSLNPRVDAAWARDAIDGIVDEYVAAMPAPVEGKAGSGVPVENAKTIVEAMYPQANITSHYRGPDHPLSRANPGSYHAHTKAAVDTARIPGVTFDQYVQSFRDAGYTVIEAIDEYKNPSAHATGGHWHIVLGDGNPGAPGVAADPRLNGQNVEAAVDAYVAANPGISERRKQALYEAGDRFVSQGRADRAQAEQDADRRLQDWLTANMADPDALTSIGQIPAELLGPASPGAKASIQARLQATRDRIQARNDAAAAERVKARENAILYGIAGMSDEEIADMDVDQLIGQVSPSSLISLKKRQTQIQTGGDYVKNDTIASVTDSIGKEIGADRSLEADAEARELWTGLNSFISAEVARRGGKDMSREDIRAIAVAGIQEVGKVNQDRGAIGGFFFGEHDEAFRFQIRSGEQYEQRGQIPPEVLQRLRGQFPGASADFIRKKYAEGLAKGLW